MFPIVLSLALLSALPAPPAASLYLPANMFLVRVRTLSVRQEAKSDYHKGRLRVTAVLTGPERLIGSEFEVSTQPPPWGGTRIQVPRFADTIIPLLEKGAEGLWWVYKDAKTQTLQPVPGDVVHEFCLEHFPYQNTKAGPPVFSEPGCRLADGMKREDLWKEGEGWAQAVAAVSVAKTDLERKVLLERFAATENSSLAGWAMAALARGPREPAAVFLRGQVKKDKLDAASQVLLDELLCRLDPNGWCGADERKKFLARWLAPTTDVSLFALGCRRIWMATPLDLEAALYVAVVGDAFAQADKMERARVLLLSEVVRLAQFRDADAAVVREFLGKLSRTAPSKEVEEAVSEALRRIPKP